MPYSFLVASLLAAEIDRLGRRRLHLIREFVGTRAGVELGVVLLVARVTLVQLLEKFELAALLRIGRSGRRLQIQDRRVALPEQRALIVAGRKPEP